MGSGGCSGLGGENGDLRWWRALTTLTLKTGSECGRSRGEQGLERWDVRAERCTWSPKATGMLAALCAPKWAQGSRHTHTGLPGWKQVHWPDSGLLG